MGNGFFITSFLLLMWYSCGVLADADAVGLWPPPVVYPKAYPKIGTWEKNYLTFWYNFYPRNSELEHQKDWSREEIERDRWETFQIVFHPHLLPPKALAISKIESKHLGWVSVVVEAPLWVDREAMAKITQDLRKSHKIWEPMVDQRNHWGRIGLVAERPRARPTTSASTTATTPATTTTPTHTPPPQKKKFIRNPPGRGEIKRDKWGMDGEIEQLSSRHTDLLRLSADPSVDFYWYWRSTLALRWRDAGKGVKIYVIDTGLDTQHIEFHDLNVEDWIYAGVKTLEEPGDDYWVNFNWMSNRALRPMVGHGTKVISKLAGGSIGVAPEADIIVVKMGREGLGFPYYSLLDAWLKTFDHIKANIDKRGGKPCIVMATRPLVTSEGHFSSSITRVFMKALADLNCYYVSSAGNMKSPPGNPVPPTHYPNLRGHEFENLIVVGGHNMTLHNLYQADYSVQISALGEQVLTVEAFMEGQRPESWDTMYTLSAGTSYSTPQVAGLLATFISQGYEDPVGYMMSLTGDPLPGEHPRIAFNGIRYEQWPENFRKGYREYEATLPLPRDTSGRGA
ncbi:serine protease [Arthrobotrys megalospora]